MAERFIRTKDTSKMTSCVLPEPLAFVTGTEGVLFCPPSSLFYLKGEVCYKEVSVSLADSQAFV